MLRGKLFLLQSLDMTFFLLGATLRLKFLSQTRNSFICHEFQKHASVWGQTFFLRTIL